VVSSSAASGAFMFDIGLQELVLIFVIALLVFGPKNLPQLGRSLGRAMREFRRASDEFRSTIETNLQMNEPDPIPPSFTPAVEPTAATAEATPLAEPVPVADGAATAAEPAVDVGEPYVAQRGAKLFHSRSCAWVKKIEESDRVYFKQIVDARESGLAACPVCEPWEPA
jgi:TatA/E family protein of Tat protein translocase